MWQFIRSILISFMIAGLNISPASAFYINSSAANTYSEKSSHESYTDTLTVGNSNTSANHAQDTNATIGQGSVIIGGEEAGEIDGLNRDITKSQELIKDELTGGLDAGLTVDLRVLDPTGEGQKQIFDELTNLPENLVKNAQFGTQAAVTMGTIAADAVGTVVSGASAEERGVIGEIKDKTGIALAETEFAKHNAKADEVLKNPGAHTAQEIAEAEQIRDSYYKRYGVSAEEYQAVVYAKADDKRHGGYVKSDKVGGVNLIEPIDPDNADAEEKRLIIDGQTMKEAGVHETVHGLGYGEEYAQALGEYAVERSGLFALFGVGYGSDSKSMGEWFSPENEAYLTGVNQYFTEHDASSTQNWAMDSPSWDKWADSSL